MEFNDLTEEQKAKAKACTTPDELVELAKTEGYELTDEQLEGIAGGSWDCGNDCGTKSCKTWCGIVGH